jgi:hypothetical protein
VALVQQSIDLGTVPGNVHPQATTKIAKVISYLVDTEATTFAIFQCPNEVA